MSYRQVRSLAVTAVVVVVGGLGWLYLAPTQIGGSTRYMITHGISMEPLLHTGDLALVRPTGTYRVGQVVAYHSALLHTVVLHRIIRVVDGQYFFKGDNNGFVDPTHPTRASLVGSMWLRIPHGGAVLEWIHKPWLAAALAGGAMLLLLFGGGRRPRRGRRRGGRSGTSNRPRRVVSPAANRLALISSAAAATIFAALSVIAFARPTSGASAVTTRYTQTLSFGYHGPARIGSVYPNGTVTTGQPIYPQLVHRITVTAAYRLTAQAVARTAGTIRIRGTLANTTGWSRSFWLGRSTHFTGTQGRATAAVNLSGLEALTSRISSQIGGDVGGSYTFAIVPEVKLKGAIGGQPLTTSYDQPLSLTIGAAQILAGSSAASGTAGTSTTGSGQTGLVRSAPGSVTSSRATANSLLGVPVATVRWLALLGLAVSSGLVLLTGSRELQASSDPVERINRRYRHLIVPVAGITPSPDHPPIEVGTIDALAQLAERSERLILHEHLADADNYLIDDQGTLFRFQALRISHVNGNGNGAGPDGVHGTAGGNGKATGNGSTVGNGAARVGAPAAVGAAAGVAGEATGAVATSSSWAGRGYTEPGDLNAGETPVAAAGAADTVSDARETVAEPVAGGGEPVVAGVTEPPAGVTETSARVAETSARVAETSARVAEAQSRIAEARATVAAEAGRRRPSSLREPIDLAADAPARGARRRQGIPARDAGERRSPGARDEQVRPATRWTNRPEVRLVLAIGPIALTVLAWWALRIRRLRGPQLDAEEQRVQAEARRGAGRRQRPAPPPTAPSVRPGRQRPRI